MRRILITINLWLIVIILTFGITSAMEFYLTVHIENRLKTEAVKVSSAANISWSAVQIRFFHQDIVLHHAKINVSRGHQLGIEQIILSPSIKFPLRLDYTTIRMKGIHFLEIPGHTTDKMNKISHFDLHKIKASMHLEVFYDPDLHSLNIKKLELSDKNWGQLQLKLVLDNFYPGKICNFQFEPLLIQTVDIQYQDYALLKQLMEFDLEKNREFNHFMAEAINQDIETAKKQNNQVHVQSLAVLQNFLENPGQLTFKMHLRQPVSFSQIINAHRVSELLEMIHYSFTNA